jgi:hypothetical protein
MLARLLSSHILKFERTKDLKHDHFEQCPYRPFFVVLVCVTISQSLVEHFLFTLYTVKPYSSFLSGV